MSSGRKRRQATDGPTVEDVNLTGDSLDAIPLPAGPPPSSLISLQLQKDSEAYGDKAMMPMDLGVSLPTVPEQCNSGSSTKMRRLNISASSCQLLTASADKSISGGAKVPFGNSKNKDESNTAEAQEEPVMAAQDSYDRVMRREKLRRRIFASLAFVRSEPDEMTEEEERRYCSEIMGLPYEAGKASAKVEEEMLEIPSLEDKDDDADKDEEEGEEVDDKSVDGDEEEDEEEGEEVDDKSVDGDEEEDEEEGEEVDDKSVDDADKDEEEGEEVDDKSVDSDEEEDEEEEGEEVDDESVDDDEEEDEEEGESDDEEKEKHKRRYSNGEGIALVRLDDSSNELEESDVSPNKGPAKMLRSPAVVLFGEGRLLEDESQATELLENDLGDPKWDLPKDNDDSNRRADEENGVVDGDNEDDVANWSEANKGNKSAEIVEKQDGDVVACLMRRVVYRVKINMSDLLTTVIFSSPYRGMQLTDAMKVYREHCRRMDTNPKDFSLFHEGLVILAAERKTGINRDRFAPASIGLMEGSRRLYFLLKHFAGLLGRNRVPEYIMVTVYPLPSGMYEKIIKELPVLYDPRDLCQPIAPSDVEQKVSITSELKGTTRIKASLICDILSRIFQACQADKQGALFTLEEQSTAWRYWAISKFGLPSATGKPKDIRVTASSIDKEIRILCEGNRTLEPKLIRSFIFGLYSAPAVREKVHDLYEKNWVMPSRKSFAKRVCVLSNRLTDVTELVGLLDEAKDLTIVDFNERLKNIKERADDEVFSKRAEILMLKATKKLLSPEERQEYSRIKKREGDRLREKAKAAAAALKQNEPAADVDVDMKGSGEDNKKKKKLQQQLAVLDCTAKSQLPVSEPAIVNYESLKALLVDFPGMANIVVASMNQIFDDSFAINGPNSIMISKLIKRYHCHVLLVGYPDSNLDILPLCDQFHQNTFVFHRRHGILSKFGRISSGTPKIPRLVVDLRHTDHENVPAILNGSLTLEKALVKHYEKVKYTKLYYLNLAPSTSSVVSFSSSTVK